MGGPLPPNDTKPVPITYERHVRILTKANLCAGGALVCSLLLAACGGSNWSRHHGPPSQGTTVVVTGDWNDIEASLTVAASRCDMAIVRVVGARLLPAEALDKPTGHVWSDLVTAGDEPVRFEVVALGTRDPREMSVWVRVGRDGDAAREARLADEFRKRLSDLTGVDAAPVR